MLKILKKWLENRFGVVLDLIPDHFRARAIDGTLIAKILRGYSIIRREDLQLIEETHDPEVAVSNFTQHIGGWLKRIGIEISEADILEITHGEGFAALSVFFQMYAELEDRSEQTKNREYWAGTHTFTVAPVKYTLDDDFFLEPNPMCEPLLEQWDVVTWERDHLEALRKKYESSRQNYQQYLEEKEVKMGAIQKPCEHLDHLETILDNNDFTYEDLVKLQNEANQMEEFTPNVKEAKKIVRNIKTRRRKQAERDAVKLQMQKELLSQVWEKLKSDQEESFNKTIAEKLLKQSKIEKGIARKMLAIRKQRDKIIENRAKENARLEKERDENFIRKLFESCLDERMKFHLERQELIAQHRRLYEEKLKLKALKHQKLCQEVMRDVVDLALKAAEYKKEFGVEPCKDLKKNWATLFVKQQPIFDLVTPVEDIKKKLEDLPDVIEEMYFKEVKRQEILDLQDLDDYLSFRNGWEQKLEAEIDRKIELGLNVIGYYVHKLLRKKYPFKIPLRPNLPQDIEVAVCATIPDTSRLSFLKKLLMQKNVVVIEMEDVIKFCLDAFAIEATVEYDEKLNEELAGLPRIEASSKEGKAAKKGKKDKKEKGSKKDKGSKKSSKKDKGSKKSKSKKGKKGDKEETPPPAVEEKVLQTPRYYPGEEIVLTRKAKLGQRVKEILDLGQNLPDDLFVDMFIEFLLAIPDLRGWLLVNYPNSFEQAALLEQALTGRPVPENYYNKILNRESLESVQVEQEEEASTIYDEEPETAEEALPPIITSILKSRSSITSDDARLHRQSTTSSNRLQQLPVEVERVEDNTNKSKQELQKVQFGVLDPNANVSVETLVDDADIKCTRRISNVLPDLISLVSADVATTRSANSLLKGTSENDQLKNADTSNQECTCICNRKKKEALGEDTTLMEEIEIKPCQCYVTTVKTAEEATETEENLTSEETKLEFGEMVETQEIAKNEELAAKNCVDEASLRLSRIVPNPRPIEEEEYKTPLTGFIKAIPKIEEDPDEEPIPIFKELLKCDGLEKFYCDQGCFYLLQHDEFNSDTVKCLAKMIIGDYSLPMKSSVELFGERYMEATFEVGDNIVIKKGKRSKGKKAKKVVKKEQKVEKKLEKEKKGKRGKKGDKDSKKSKDSKKLKKSGKGKKGKKGKVEMESEPIVLADKVIQFPEIEEEEIEYIPEPRAGEPLWIFTDLPIPNDLEIAYVTSWENMEQNYIANFKQLFFTKRVLLNAVLPYVCQVREVMKQFITRPDQKQFYMHEFQKTLNEISLDLRDDDSTKAELLCQIDLFKDKLLGICDTKMQESEEERRRIIETNWIFRQLCEIARNSEIAFQLEIDRCVDSLQFVTDFFSSVITKIGRKEGSEIVKSQIERSECTEEMKQEFGELLKICEEEKEEKKPEKKAEEVGAEEEGEADVRSKLKICEEGRDLKPEQEAEEVGAEEEGEAEVKSAKLERCKRTGFYVNIDNTYIWALRFVNATKEVALESVKKMQKFFREKKKEKKKKKNEPKPFEPDEDVKELAPRIFEEWNCALYGKITRTERQLDLIKSEMLTRLEEIIGWSKNVFCDIYREIEENYQKELTSVERACEILAKAVEDVIVLRPELVLDGDQLAEVKISLFPETVIDETLQYRDSTFRIQQLDFMTRILLDLAPNGFILKQTFLLLLQDMLYQGNEKIPEILKKESHPSFENVSHNSETAIPKLWRNSSTGTLKELFSRIFDDNEYIPWKDFIVTNLMVPFPSREELMEVRTRFRNRDPYLEETVTEEDYNNIELWFERCVENKNSKIIKDLLYRMYGKPDNYFSYAAMLLDFCKSKNPIEGFVKALELSLGKFICYDQTTGEDYVAQLMDIRNQDEVADRLRQEEHDVATIETRKALSVLVDQIVHRCESAVIEEILEEDVLFPTSPEKTEEGTSRSDSINTRYSQEDSIVGFLTEKKFSNVAIGFEARGDTGLCYFLPFDLVSVVIVAALPWHSKVEVPGLPSFLDRIEELHKNCRNYNFNNAVLSHEFLNCEEFKAIFGNVAKFSASNPVKLVKEIASGP